MYVFPHFAHFVGNGDVAVPFFNLPRLHEAMTFDTPQAPQGFVRGIKRILEIQKRQRTDPDYTYMPEFPPTAAAPRLASG